MVLRPALPVVLCVAIAAALVAGAVAPARAVGATPQADARWTEARAKANGSGVRLEYTLPASMPVGRPATVGLRLSGVRGDDARVEWRAPEGVAVRDVSGAGTARALPRDAVTTLVLEATPGRDGRAYLDVFTMQHGRRSAHSIPLKVGSDAIALKREGEAKTTPAGEKVIVLPSTPR